MNECTVPVPRISEDNRWHNQYTRHVHECKEAEPDVLLIGDSIIQKMVNFETFWNHVSAFHPLNLGIGGDGIQHVLWRILNSPLEQTNPRVVVLHCGTNNQNNTAQEISEGIIKIVEELRKLFPSAFIIVWGLLPRGEFPTHTTRKNEKVNSILKKILGKDNQVELICTGHILRSSTEVISHKDMPDYLHLSEIGYEKTFTPVLNRLKEIFNSPNDSNLQLYDN